MERNRPETSKHFFLRFIALLLIPALLSNPLWAQGMAAPWVPLAKRPMTTLFEQEAVVQKLLPFSGFNHAWKTPARLSIAGLLAGFQNQPAQQQQGPDRREGALERSMRTLRSGTIYVRGLSLPRDVVVIGNSTGDGHWTFWKSGSSLSQSLSMEQAALIAELETYRPVPLFVGMKLSMNRVEWELRELGETLKMFEVDRPSVTMNLSIIRFADNLSEGTLVMGSPQKQIAKKKNAEKKPEVLIPLIGRGVSLENSPLARPWKLYRRRDSSDFILIKDRTTEGSLAYLKIDAEGVEQEATVLDSELGALLAGYAQIPLHAGSYFKEKDGDRLWRIRSVGETFTILNTDEGLSRTELQEWPATEFMRFWHAGLYQGGISGTRILGTASGGFIGSLFDLFYSGIDERFPLDSPDQRLKRHELRTAPVLATLLFQAIPTLLGMFGASLFSDNHQTIAWVGFGVSLLAALLYGSKWAHAHVYTGTNLSTRPAGWPDWRRLMARGVVEAVAFNIILDVFKLADLGTFFGLLVAMIMVAAGHSLSNILQRRSGGVIGTSWLRRTYTRERPLKMDLTLSDEETLALVKELLLTEWIQIPHIGLGWVYDKKGPNLTIQIKERHHEFSIYELTQRLKGLTPAKIEDLTPPVKKRKKTDRKKEVVDLLNFTKRGDGQTIFPPEAVEIILLTESMSNGDIGEELRKPAQTIKNIINRYRHKMQDYLSEPGQLYSRKVVDKPLEFIYMKGPALPNVFTYRTLSGTAPTPLQTVSLKDLASLLEGYQRVPLIPGSHITSTKAGQVWSLRVAGEKIIANPIHSGDVLKISIFDFAMGLSRGRYVVKPPAVIVGPRIIKWANDPLTYPDLSKVKSVEEMKVWLRQRKAGDVIYVPEDFFGKVVRGSGDTLDIDLGTRRQTYNITHLAEAYQRAANNGIFKTRWLPRWAQSKSEIASYIQRVIDYRAQKKLLTDRQFTILRAASLFPNQSIARELGITVTTVKNHLYDVGKILKKTFLSLVVLVGILGTVHLYRHTLTAA